MAATFQTSPIAQHLQVTTILNYGCHFYDRINAVGNLNDCSSMQVLHSNLPKIILNPFTTHQKTDSTNSI